MGRWLGSFVGCALSVCGPLWWAAAAAPTPDAPTAGRRVALVIGNAAYPTGPLATAANDAGLVSQALAQAGFDVTAAADTDDATLRRTVHDFEGVAKRAGPGAVVLVYFSGFGVQFDGDNFFAPIDASIAHADDVPGQTLRLSDLSRAVEATQAGTRIFLFDLAYANPFVKGDSMPLAAGLSLVPAVKDSLYAFNAAPGVTAGLNAPPYGVFARALTEMIQTPGLTMQALFDRLRLRVGELTDGAVVPWDDSKVDSGFTFYPASGAAPAPTAAPIDEVPIGALSADVAYSVVVARDSLSGYQDFARTFARDPLAARVTGLLAARREALTWTEALAADDPRALWTYMRRYPRGQHLFDARRVLAALHAPLEPPPRFDIYDFADVPPPGPNEVALLALPDAVFPDRDWAPIPPPPGAFLPSPRAAYYDELPPPLPTPAGILPIAAPLPVTDTAGRSLPIAEGQIVQVGSAGAQKVTTKTVAAADGGSILTLTAGPPTRVLSRATTTLGSAGDRIIVQADPKSQILSRTLTVHVPGGLTTIQTGAKGGLIMKIVTRAEPTGGRAFEVTNDRNEIVADLRRDNQGIVVKRDIVAMREQVRPPASASANEVKRPSGAIAQAHPPVAPLPRRGAQTPVPASAAPQERVGVSRAETEAPPVSAAAPPVAAAPDAATAPPTAVPLPPHRPKTEPSARPTPPRKPPEAKASPRETNTTARKRPEPKALAHKPVARQPPDQNAPARRKPATAAAKPPNAPRAARAAGLLAKPRGRRR